MRDYFFFLNQAHIRVVQKLTQAVTEDEDNVHAGHSWRKISLVKSSDSCKIKNILQVMTEKHKQKHKVRTENVFNISDLDHSYTLNI